jgi:signal transduction histidine kinase
MERAERKRVEAVVETLATLRSQGESLAEVAHDARNMVTALGLYCDLLEEPGVLAGPFLHYGSELRLVAAASRRLVEKLVALDAQAATGSAWPEPGGEVAASVPAGLHPEAGGRAERKLCWELMPAEPVNNLAAELLASRNLLAALAGPGIALTVDVEGGAKPVRMTAEDLTRVLVNLAKNAAEAMPAGGRVVISLCERPAAAGTPELLAITMEDNGPGIAADALEAIFASGYTTRATETGTGGSWPVTHRGLGLAISRSIVEAAGGRIFAANRAQGGARFEIELPVRTH